MARRLPRLAAAVTVPALVAACSGSGGGDRTAAPVTTATTEAPAVTPAAEAPASTTTTSAAPPATTATTARTAAAAPAVLRPAQPGEPEVADNPRDLAAQIVQTQAAIADPATPPDELRRMAHLNQLTFRRLVAVPEWRSAVLAALPAPLRDLTEANVAAGGKLRSLIAKPKDTLPAWRIVSPAPAEELLGYYREAEVTTGVPWQYLAAIHLTETRMGRIRGTSTAGAQGPMQFMPATWAAYGEGDINSNRDAIAAAARYLKRNGAPGDMRKALWNYNHDYRYVDAVTLYAEQMAADPRAYVGYHGWQVYYLTTTGDVWLPEGWESPPR